MSQAPSVTSSSPTYLSLQNALGSLELDLEAELRRYRRHRSAELPQQKQPNGVNGWQSVPEESSVEVEAQSAASQNGAYSYGSVSLPTPESPANRSPEVDRVLERIRNPAATDEPYPLFNLDNQQVPPEDYLDSSEELLKSLEVDESKASQKKMQSRSLTPRQMGLVGAGIVGGVLLLAIAVSNIFGKDKTPAPIATTSAPATNATTGTGTATEPSTVNLASQEFVNLSLDNLSVVTPTDNEPAPVKPAVPTPLPNANPTAPNANSTAIAPQQPPLANPTGRDNLASALLPPSLRPQPVTPFPVTPQIAAAQPQGLGNETMVTPDGLKVGYYYVIFRNTNPKSVGKAQELVKSAFVRTFPIGRAVQMAEVSSEAKAQALVQKFNTEKVAAEIYHHQLSPVAKP